MMMKWRKLIALFSVLLMGFSVFAGCDNGENQPKDTYYTITFALNGGEISGKDVSDGIQIKSGSTFDLSGYQPVRPGFAFQGWKSGSTDYAWDAKIPMNSDITLTAQWQANSYTLTLELNGGSLADGEDSFTLTHGQTFDLSALTAERGGFRLTGWKSGETAYLPDETITVTGNMTLTAQWTLDSSPADMFVFDELEDGSVALAGLAEGVTPESIVLSAAYGDKKITEIKDSAFKDVDSLKYVYLDGATELQKIGDDAFANCSNLEIVSLKGLAKLETLGESVFEGAYSYSETIPNSLKVVDFSGCTALKSIGNYAFRYQRTLGKVDLSVCRNLTTIGKEGFAYCEALETLSLPVSLGEISADFFTGCNSLQRVDVAEGNIFLYSEAGVLYDADQTELIRFPAKSKITEYVVPETVTSIRAGAFAGADLLEKIVLPASVSIKTSTVFADCSSLQEIKFGADPSDNLVIDGVLYNAEGTQLLRYPAGKIDAEFSIPETVLVVADGAFLNAVHLRTLKIPKNVISFGDKLKGCSSLERVEVDEGNTAYSSLDGIFYNKAQTKLLRYPILWKGTGESYTAPATLTETFAEYAFQGAVYLKSLDLSQLSRTTDLSLPEIKELLALETLSLPKTMKVLYGGNVFGGNPNLKTIELNGNPNMVFENGVLYNAAKSKLLAICGGAKLTKYVAPSTLTSIAKDVFKHAVTLKEIDLSQSGVRTYSVSSGDQGFATCTALEKVILPSKAGSSFNITHMAGLATLKEIVVPENATYYMSEDGVLYDKAQSTVLIYPAGKEAESYTMPETVTKIQTVAFKNAVHLKSIDLTAGKLTYVYANAFNGCTNATISLLCDERGFYEDGSSVTLRENWNEGVKEVKYHARYYFFTLTVDGLKDGAVTSKNPTFTASATYGDDVAELEVKLNGTVVAASANGYTLNLAEGENTVTILASFGDESREYSYTLTKDSTSYLDWTLHEDGEKTGGELTFDVAAQNIDKESVRVDSLQLFVKTAADGDWRSVGDENCTIVYDADHLKADVSLYVSKLLNANGTFSLKVVMNGEELVVETCEYLKPSASLKTDIESSTPTVPATKDWTFTVSLNGAEDLPVDIKNRVEIWADCGRDGWENIRPDDWGFKIAYSADGTTATVTMNRQNMEWNMLGDFTEPFRMMIRVEAGGAVHVLFFEVE